ncbi:uncharacterized protein GGS22DRAFT_120384 [Annulohypoxylon maeteangense]|uniref:uncharacterized protein n=1 Tax=Annulohypoxylon maeteangense TaxID=1927788 RepID=UPI0020085A9B|nr:uncharacterized protein GGS22DRAFT_120384 [Annulohypoxylon maeteangense]KAI0887004.1 hypothetical protein GGS22DRAFT_120384 [Annulohypoxylon maeteangense]
MKLETSSHSPPRRIDYKTGLWFIIIITLIWLFNQHWAESELSLSELQQILLSVPSSEHVRNWSSYYTTTGSHLPGQGLRHAEWTEARWKDFGIADVRIATYDTQVPMPTGRQRLALLRGDRVLYEAPLVDDSATDSFFASTGFVPAYYGFSANANISAPYVFCNFGSTQDYDDLKRLNISLAGRIAIVKSTNASPYLHSRHLEIFRGIQVANAEARGAVGIVLYVDLQNDGPVTEANGFKPFPDGPARPLTGIERGTLGNLEDFYGGWLAKIPSMPVSTSDSIHLLRALNTHGPLAADLSDRWHGGALDFYGVDYNVGPSPPGVSIHLVNQATLHNVSVRNVIATIHGTSADGEVVIIGNHRDAWGPGAGDPNSGSAALNEVVRSFGVALKSGWRPHRTIVFASWEGEEFGQIGSLPWIRENLEWLQASAVAYLNVVVAASGMVFRAKGSPLLHRMLYYATDLVTSPNQTVANQSVRDVWGGEIGTAGGGDAIRFQGLPCVATVDFGFVPGLGTRHGVFPYHTGFDTYDWMDRVGDPGWHYHVTSAQIWSLMTARLAQSQVLDMSIVNYAVAIRDWAMEIDQMWPSMIDLSALHGAIQRLAGAASVFDTHADSLRVSTKPWWEIWSTSRRDAEIRQVNNIYAAFERQFFYGPGLDDNPSLHHVMYGPSAWHNEAPPMPGLRQSLTAANWTNAERWRDIIIQKVNDATHLLNGQNVIWSEL